MDKVLNEDFFENEDFQKITDSTISRAEEFARDNAKESKNDKKGISSTQLRKFYGAVKLWQMNGYDPSELVMLKPKLAYAVGRAKKDCAQTKMQNLYDILTDAIDKVNKFKDEDKETAYKNFVNIFEAIVAYHKQYTNEK